MSQRKTILYDGVNTSLAVLAKNDVTGYVRLLKTLYWSDSQGTFTLTPAGRVFLTPIEVPFICTINAIALIITTQAGNLRVGLYRAVGDIPDGGAVVVESASIACGGAGVQEFPVAATQLTPGLYFLAIESDTTTAQIWRGAGGFGSSNPTFGAVRYDRGGGYGALTDPCPATTGTGLSHPVGYLMVSAIP